MPVVPRGLAHFLFVRLRDGLDEQRIADDAAACAIGGLKFFPHSLGI